MFQVTINYYKEQTEFVVNVYKDGVFQELHYCHSSSEVSTLLDDLVIRLDN